MAISKQESLPLKKENAYKQWRDRHDLSVDQNGKELNQVLISTPNLPRFSIFIAGEKDGYDINIGTPKSLKAQIFSDFDDQCIDASDSLSTITVNENEKHRNYLIFLANGDQLAPDALAHFALSIKHNQYPSLIYCDHDNLSPKGIRLNVHFKPDWNQALFESSGYINRTFAIRADLFETISKDIAELREGGLFELFLKAYLDTDTPKPFHIPRPLFHLVEDNDHIKQEQEQRLAILKKHQSGPNKANVYQTGEHGLIKISQKLPKTAPMVSIIIPTRDRANLMKIVLKGLFEDTDYPNFEVIVVDNASVEPETFAVFKTYQDRPNFHVVSYPNAFNFSAMMNLGANAASGSLLCLLNNDIEVERADWLSEMVGWALRDDVGAVGAKLLYPDRRIQHAGVILGMRGPANHGFKFFAEDEAGYQNRLQAVQDYSAVTAACLVVKKELFERVGGFDADNLAITYNDVDFCLKLGTINKRIIYTPFACLIHHESVSRGGKRSPEAEEQARQEQGFFQKKWDELIKNDPHYSPHLSRMTDDFSVRTP